MQRAIRRNRNEKKLRKVTRIIRDLWGRADLLPKKWRDNMVRGSERLDLKQRRSENKRALARALDDFEIEQAEDDYLSDH